MPKNDEEEEVVLEVKEEDQEKDLKDGAADDKKAKPKRRGLRGEARANRPIRRTQTPGGPDDYLIRERRTAVETKEKEEKSSNN